MFKLTKELDESDKKLDEVHTANFNINRNKIAGVEQKSDEEMKSLQSDVHSTKTRVGRSEKEIGGIKDIINEIWSKCSETQAKVV